MEQSTRESVHLVHLINVEQHQAAADHIVNKPTAIICIHHHHLLLLSPKADTHFTVPCRVKGSVVGCYGSWKRWKTNLEWKKPDKVDNAAAEHHVICIHGHVADDLSDGNDVTGEVPHRQ